MARKLCTGCFSTDITVASTRINNAKIRIGGSKKDQPNINTMGNVHQPVSQMHKDTQHIAEQNIAISSHLEAVFLIQGFHSNPRLTEYSVRRSSSGAVVHAVASQVSVSNQTESPIRVTIANIVSTMARYVISPRLIDSRVETKRIMPQPTSLWWPGNVIAGSALSREKKAYLLFSIKVGNISERLLAAHDSSLAPFAFPFPSGANPRRKVFSVMFTGIKNCVR